MTWDPQQPGTGRPHHGYGPPPVPQGHYYGATPPPQPGYYAGPPHPYGQPIPYGQYGPTRPTSATVMAIIGLVLGGIAVINHGLGLAMAAGAGPIARGLAIPVWPKVDSAISLVLWIVGIVGCIGLLRLSAGSRRLMLAWSAAYLLWLVVCAAMGVTQTAPEVISRAGPNRPPGFEQGVYGGILCMLLLIGVYPVLLLSLLTRPNVVAAYEGNVSP